MSGLDFWAWTSRVGVGCSGSRVGRRSLGRGVSSSVLGGLSLAAVIAARQFDLLTHSGRGHVLSVAKKLGWIRQPDYDAIQEIRSTSWFTVTDGSAIAALGTLGASAAVGALVLALWAEHGREDSLYLSVGFICAGMALVLIHPLVGIPVMAAIATLILALRRRSIGQDWAR
jgi:uncharacterized membrane protein